jgi:hypothetical protein
MTDDDTISIYLRHLDELWTLDRSEDDGRDEAAQVQLTLNTHFGMGLLMGAGYPGTAAAFAFLLKKAYPRARLPEIVRTKPR